MSRGIWANYTLLRGRVPFVAKADLGELESRFGTFSKSATTGDRLVMNKEIQKIR